MNFLLSALFSANLVATFSTETQTNFVNSCIKGSDKEICSCVLEKLEAKYSEAEFKKWESKMLRGEPVNEYVDFIVNARNNCSLISIPSGSASGALVAGTAAKQPNEALKPTAPENKTTEKQPSLIEQEIFKTILSNKKFKKSFTEECSDEIDDYLGKKDAQRSCECAYNNLLTNEAPIHLLMSSLDEDGKVDNFEKWGFGIISTCLPKNFTPEMEKAFIKECKDNFNKNQCKCAFTEISKKYTVQSLLQEGFQNEKQFEANIRTMIGSCLAK